MQPLTVTFSSGVSDLQVWDGRRDPQVGVCLPEEDRILIGPVRDAFEWADGVGSPIGPETGRPADLLQNPLAFDVASDDGRIYVLDAGNARIVVYDAARSYVTEWGGFGIDDGEFNFGLGGGRLSSGEPDFAGSIAVDDNGFIYVADPVNNRIQKFEP